MSRAERREALLARFRTGSLARIVEILATLEAADALEPSVVAPLRAPLHTLKGEARMLGLASLAGLVHALEDQLAVDDGGHSLAPIRAVVALIHERLQAPLVENSEAARALERGLALLSGVEPPGAATPGKPTAASAAQPLAFSQIRVDLVEELCERLEVLRVRAHPSDSQRAATLDQEFRQELAELTELAWSLRLVPIEPALETLADHARELGRQLGKPLRVLIDAGGAQLERSLLERLQEPLMHLIRNAVDHGVEPGPSRANKPLEATLKIIARSDGPEVVLAVVDDGRGVDIEQVRSQAQARGLLAAAEAGAATPRDLLSLLFKPGFSTNQSINELSGRGIGLDAVRRAVEGLGGEVSLTSTIDRGARCELRVPATISRETVVVVPFGRSLWGLPSRRVARVTALSERESTGGATSIVVDGEHVPLVSLARLLGIPNAHLIEDRVAICFQHGGRIHALASPPVLGEFELFRRPMGPLLAAVGPASASAVMDDGRLVLLLEPAALLGQRIRAEPRERPPKPLAPRSRVLVVDDSPIVLELLVELLTSARLEVCTASDGVEALELLGCRNVDLVVSDVEMPNMDGFELLARVRQLDSELPVIMVTTRGSAADRERASSLGADAYLVKSDFRRQHMLEVVARFVEVER
ncbi:Signal transduction histidine kinase CheA [Enhygromyxa salina]|uniref:histidine kinase n=1 Tax=Enhygromyxa salina TaxID=215803 RepID=A0A0C1ZT74_9BACT|nr:response regulator [Enhygromyxa salina]KIG14213.1 Signal transduction histidine kinase CheA [Enhygromyxa salina]